ncbi:putative prophage phiRv2 integrase [Thalassoglobus neptunius]|uniref:Putative prophage phiRv2 integrase n=1 Tax=Thalassoglobus neptunius TaxID=1938619 RepID=A0A5C5X743_9PLAN|nr:site-specific integrase [Thalassoglobus neptunius]TWT58866.1 putative prophage phiRv2 integrase [Thalassoglobus neptunius]
MAKKRSKRDYGSGTVYQEADGRWRYSARTLEGQRIRRRARNEQEAHEGLRDLLDELYPIHYSDFEESLSGATVKILIDRYIADRSKLKKTSKDYYDRVRVHLGELEELSVHELTSSMVSQWLEDLEENGVNSQRRNAFDLLSRSLDHAVKKGEIDKNPCKVIPRPGYDRKKVKAFTTTQMEQILNDAQNDDLFGVYLLAFLSGMRQSEIFGLLWKHIDFGAGKILIEQGLVETDGTIFIETTPKTSNSYRLIDIPVETMEVIRTIKESRAGFETDQTIQVANGERKLHARDFVFLNQRGSFLRRSNFANRNWKPRLRRLNLDECGFHSARHTAASIALSNGLPVTRAAAWLGDTVEVLMKTYAHWIDSDHSQAVHVMETVRKKSAKSTGKKSQSKTSGQQRGSGEPNGEPKRTKANRNGRK